MNKKETLREIILARVKTMSPDVKVALGSEGKFLTRDEMLREIKSKSSTGEKILKIQLNYLQALKKGIV